MEAKKKLTGYPSVDKPWLKYYTEEAINAKLPECTIYEYIYEKNKSNLNKPAIRYFDNCFSYSEMFSYIDKAERSFSAMGILKGDFVSLCLLTMPETIYCIYSLNKLGAISNLIEPRTNAELIRDRINESNSKILVVVDVFLSKILQIVEQTKLEKIIVIPISESMPRGVKLGFRTTKGRKIQSIPNDTKYMYWKDFLIRGKDHCPKPVKYEKNYPAAIIYTGGTTGVSKGALLSNDCFTAMAMQAYYDAPTLFTGGRFLEIMPPFIAYGLIFGHFIPFCAGLENCLIPVFEPKKFAKLVLKNKPNHVVGVPAFFENLANSNLLKGKKMDYLRTCITGGDKLLVSTEKHINDIYKLHFCPNPILKGYGMTEMGSAATFTVIKECNVEGSVGIPIHNVTIKVIDPNTGEELKYNQRGELCMTGPTMMLKYYNNQRETDNVMKKHADGLTWVHTGDIGYITEDGVVFIVDRIKRMIIRPDGHNVWPSVIENVITKHFAVLDCAVVGLANTENKNGKIPTAFVVIKDNITINDGLIEDIDSFCKKQLPERDVAMAYRFCDKLPLTLVGKVDYRALEKEAETHVKRLND